MHQDHDPGSGSSAQIGNQLGDWSLDPVAHVLIPENQSQAQGICYVTDVSIDPSIWGPEARASQSQLRCTSSPELRIDLRSLQGGQVWMRPAVVAECMALTGGPPEDPGMGCGLVPMQKNVPRISYFLSRSSTNGVTSGSGPSSKVRYTIGRLSSISQMHPGKKERSHRGVLIK